MIPCEGNFSTRIYTKRGLIESSKLIPTDIVYDFNTGEEVEILSMHKHLSSKFLEVEFADGRTQVIDKHDRLFNIPSFLSKSKSSTVFPYIPCKSYEFNNTSTFKISPYVMGLFCIYGDRGDKFINLPVDKQPDTEWYLEQNLVISNYMGKDNKVYYSYADRPDMPIAWADFFPENSTFNTVSKLIPTEYFMASPQSRLNMIRGIFDAGYNVGNFPDNCHITFNSVTALIEVRELLLSVGILSRITYSPDGNHRLDVIDDNQLSPSLFYNHKYIARMISLSELYDTKGEEPRITRVKEYHPYGIHPRFMLLNIIAKRPNVVIIGENFLPRITI